MSRNLIARTCAVLLLLPLLGSTAEANDTSDYLFRIPSGSEVWAAEIAAPQGFFTVVGWTTDSDDTQAKASISPWGGSVLASFDDANAATLTVAEDLSDGHLEADFPQIGFVDVTLTLWPWLDQRTFWGNCPNYKHGWELFSPTKKLAFDGWIHSSGSIDGYPIGDTVCRTYGQDVTGIVYNTSVG